MNKLSIVSVAILGLSACGTGSVAVCDLMDDYEAACATTATSTTTTTLFEYGECDDTACTDEELDLAAAYYECDLAQEDPCAVNAACELEYAAVETVGIACLYGLAGISAGSTWGSSTTTTSNYTTVTTPYSTISSTTKSSQWE